MRVLVLEDDPDLRRSLLLHLRAAGYATDGCGTLAGADERLRVNHYDAAVLDRDVPGGDAADLLGRLRVDGCTVPTLLLTAASAVPDRIAGLRAGADDYVGKPFAMPELVERVHALCRRPGGALAPPVLQVGDLTCEPATRRAGRAGRSLALTGREWCLLHLLLSRAGQVLSRSELLEHCWDEFADPSSNVVDVRVASLRRKLGPPEAVRTVRGAGYIIDTVPPGPGP